MSEQLQTLKSEIEALRSEIAQIENLQRVRAQGVDTDTYAAMSVRRDALYAELNKKTKQAAKLLKLKKPARI